jgi:multidrug efflux system membrane fusion protein
MRRQTPEIPFALSLVLLAGVTALAGCKPAQTAVSEIRPVRVATVERRTAHNVVRYPAVVRPRLEADLGFRIGGKVVERLVDVGARVGAGTPLARLDPADSELQVRAASAQLAAARAEADNARADFQRYARLRQGEWATRQEYDRRRAALETAEARVREIEAQQRVVENNRRYAVLEADGPGIVTAVLVEPGQVVTQGQPAMRVAREGGVEVVANIPEHQIARLSERSLSVKLWSLPDVSIRGTLREVAPSADPVTRTYQVRISLAQVPPAVQLGMTATLVSREPQAARVALLPLTAITQQGRDPAVWVVKPDGQSLELRPVEVTAYRGDTAVIADGLRDGEQVVTAGVYKLDASQRVRVWTEPAP